MRVVGMQEPLFAQSRDDKFGSSSSSAFLPLALLFARPLRALNTESSTLLLPA